MAFDVVVDGPRIFLQPPDDPRIEIFPESESRFFTKGYKSGVSFVRNASGEVVRMIKHVNNRDIAFERVSPAPALDDPSK